MGFYNERHEEVVRLSKLRTSKIYLKTCIKRMEPFLVDEEMQLQVARAETYLEEVIDDLIGKAEEKLT